MPTNPVPVSPFLTFAERLHKDAEWLKGPLAHSVEHPNGSGMHWGEVASLLRDIGETDLSQAERHARLLAQIKQWAEQQCGAEPQHLLWASGYDDARAHIKALLEQP